MTAVSRIKRGFSCQWFEFDHEVQRDHVNVEGFEAMNSGGEQRGRARGGIL